MSELGHVWTAPWQELSDVFAALVGCGHVSGLLMRRVWPLALMLCADRVPNKNAHFRSRALTQAGSPDPRNDRICYTSSCPRQLVSPIYLPVRGSGVVREDAGHRGKVADVAFDDAEQRDDRRLVGRD